MKNNINDTLEQIVKILIVLVIALIIIGIVTVGNRFIKSLQSNVDTVPSYDEYMPQYYDKN